MTTTFKTTTDPLGDWFRHIGTKLSDTDYEAGIRAIAWARDQFQPEHMNPERPDRTNADTSRISAEPSDAEVWAAAEEAEYHEQWVYDEDGFPHCECGASLVESEHDLGVVPSLMAHQVRAVLLAARKVSGR